jgi:hypothetical protein
MIAVMNGVSFFSRKMLSKTRLPDIVIETVFILIDEANWQIGQFSSFCPENFEEGELVTLSTVILFS